MSNNGMNYPMYKYDRNDNFILFILLGHFSTAAYSQMTQQQQQQQTFYGQRFSNSLQQV